MSVTVIDQSNYHTYLDNAVPLYSQNAPASLEEYARDYQTAVSAALQDGEIETAEALVRQFTADMIDLYQDYYDQRLFSEMDRVYRLLENSLNPLFGLLFTNVRGSAISRGSADPRSITVIIVFSNAAELRAGGSVVTGEDECDPDLYAQELATIEEIRTLQQQMQGELDELQPLQHRVSLNQITNTDFLTSEYERLRDLVLDNISVPTQNPDQMTDLIDGDGQISEATLAQLNDILANEPAADSLNSPSPSPGQESSSSFHGPLEEDETVQDFLFEFEQSFDDLPLEIQAEYTKALDEGDTAGALSLALRVESDRIREYYRQQIESRMAQLSGLRERVSGGESCHINRSGTEYYIYRDESDGPEVKPVFIDIFDENSEGDEPSESFVLR